MRRALLTLAAFLTTSLPAAAQSRISIDVHDADVADVIRLLATESGRNIIADSSIKPQRVVLRLHDVSPDEAIAAFSRAYGLQSHREAGVTILGDAASMNRRFGDGAAGAGQTAIIALLHSKPDEVETALKAALPTSAVVVGDKRSNAVVVTADPPTVARARTIAAALDAPVYGGSAVGADAVPLRYAKASDLARALKGAIPDNTMLADDARNVVVVTGNQETRTQVRALIAALDAPGRQVMFDVRVADVTPFDESSNVGFTFGGPGYAEKGALGSFVYTLTRSSVVVNAQLNALVTANHAQIIAQPRLAALNNQEAALLVGETYPIVVTNLQTGFPTVNTIDIGVKLRITPTIGDDGSIVADLHPEYSAISGFNAQYPIIANRKIDARIRVRDGETIVLGGLMQDTDSSTVTKLPFLGDLPLFGGFFRNRQRTHARNEVVFFITPHVL